MFIEFKTAGAKFIYTRKLRNAKDSLSFDRRQKVIIQFDTRDTESIKTISRELLHSLNKNTIPIDNRLITDKHNVACR